MFTHKYKVEDIEESKETGFLYIFEAERYEKEMYKPLYDVSKLGMTKGSIKDRLKQYKSKPKKISFIQCSEPHKRERLIKSYIREKLRIIPERGFEYFKDCRKLLESVILYFALCDLDIINKYIEKYNSEEKIEWFNSICIKHIDIHCVWCKEEFETSDELKDHYKVCTVDKEKKYSDLLNRYNFQSRCLEIIEEREHKEQSEEMRLHSEEIDNLCNEYERKIENLKNLIRQTIDQPISNL